MVDAATKAVMDVAAGVRKLCKDRFSTTNLSQLSSTHFGGGPKGCPATGRNKRSSDSGAIPDSVPVAMGEDKRRRMSTGSVQDQASADQPSTSTSASQQQQPTTTTVRLLMFHATTCAAERKRSLWGNLFTKARNGLAIERAEKLVAMHLPCTGPTQRCTARRPSSSS